VPTPWHGIDSETIQYYCACVHPGPVSVREIKQSIVSRLWGGLVPAIIRCVSVRNSIFVNFCSIMFLALQFSNYFITTDLHQIWHECVPFHVIKTDKGDLRKIANKVKMVKKNRKN